VREVVSLGESGVDAPSQVMKEEARVDVTWFCSSASDDRFLKGVLILLAASACRGDHPLSRGIEEGIGRLIGTDALAQVLAGIDVEDFESVTGHGVRFRLGTMRADVGSTSWNSRDDGPQASNDAALTPKLREWMEAERARASTVVAARVSGVVVGLVALCDPLQPSAKAVIEELHRSNEDVWMCTGDHAQTANAVAEELGLPPDRVVAGAPPSEKARLVEKLQADAQRVVVVGDGVNDAPALAAANVGVAIGAGVRITVDAADVVLVRSDLRDLLAFRQLASATVFCIRRNFMWATVFNGAMLPLAAGVLWHHGIHIKPEMAGAAMATSSIMVVTSSLLLRGFRPSGAAAVSEVDAVSQLSLERQPLKESS